jgi:hypothetical protein
LKDAILIPADALPGRMTAEKIEATSIRLYALNDGSTRLPDTDRVDGCILQTESCCQLNMPRAAPELFASVFSADQ